jgi:hypothetical protein
MTGTQALAERLPEPDWSRPGEYWRVAPEPNMDILPPGARCAHREAHAKQTCPDEAVAVIRAAGMPLCRRHIRVHGLWIEGGQVVSWALGR